MTIKIYAIGKIKDFYKSGCDEYLKRITGYTKIEVIELKDESVSDKPSPSEITKVKDVEGKRVLSLLKSNEYLIGLDLNKKQFYYVIDGSGFIYACYNLAGFKIKCSLAKDYVNNKNFKKIKNEDLKAGDIVSFPNSGHVIMFLAFKNNIDGEKRYYCIHEPSSGNFLKTGLHKIEDGIPLTYCD